MCLPQGELRFYGHQSDLNESANFTKSLIQLYKQEWVVYAKCPFAGPKPVLAYFSRYTHRVCSGTLNLAT